MRKLFEDAEKALGEAKKEYERYLKEKEGVILREACEKGWMATFLATDYLLMQKYGRKKPESAEERRRALYDLESLREEVKAHNLRDRFGSRAYHLHIIGFYEGQLKPDELVTELEKVEKYLDVIRGLVRGGER